MLSLSQFFAQDFAAAADTVAHALDEAGDPESLMVARAMSGLAAASWPASAPDPLRPDTLVAALRDLHLVDKLHDDARAFIVYLLAEAALACARLDLATQFIERSGPLPLGFLGRDGEAHPFLTVIQAMRMRAFGFNGQLSEALAVGDMALACQKTPLMSVFLESTQCFVLGNAGQGATVTAMADHLEATLLEPVGYVASGCYLLVGYGLLAVGEVTRAVAFLLAAAPSSSLEGVSVIDRAFGLELLVAAAVGAEDLDAAESWRGEAAQLLDHPIARPTIERIYSRVELLAGRPAEASGWARLATEHAANDGRSFEAAEGETLLASAQAAMPGAGLPDDRLESLVSAAVETGHLAARRSAAKQLRSVGRRLRPHPGAGWSGLSEREQEIARYIAEGLGNQAIGGKLHLSQHTVRAHVSRVLAAFGVASRFAVAARLTELVPRNAEGEPELAALTPRQEAVVDCIVLGRSNEDIATEMQISIKTVEKHVSEILRRWQVTSRIGIARAALSRSFSPNAVRTEPESRTAS
jgi:DNA-binding NarL/FixJ family response regulator